MFKSFLKISKIYCIGILLTFISTNSFTQNSRDYLSFSGALFDIIQNTNSSMEGRVEFKANSVNLLFKPFAGIMVNTNDAKHLYIGAYYEIPVTKMFSIVPSFAPGIYYKGESKDLHFILEFRSQVELLLNLQNQIKAGISFNHISNASLGSLNPGVESLALTFQFPVF